MEANEAKNKAVSAAAPTAPEVEEKDLSTARVWESPCVTGELIDFDPKLHKAPLPPPEPEGPPTEP